MEDQSNKQNIIEKYKGYLIRYFNIGKNDEDYVDELLYDMAGELLIYFIKKVDNSMDEL